MTQNNPMDTLETASAAIRDITKNAAFRESDVEKFETAFAVKHDERDNHEGFIKRPEPIKSAWIRGEYLGTTPRPIVDNLVDVLNFQIVVESGTALAVALVDRHGNLVAVSDGSYQLSNLNLPVDGVWAFVAKVADMALYFPNDFNPSTVIVPGDNNSDSVFGTITYRLAQ